MMHTNSIASEYVLDKVREYFSERADAELFTDSSNPVPNEEMQRLVEVFDAIDLIARLKSENEALRKAQELADLQREYFGECLSILEQYADNQAYSDYVDHLKECCIEYPEELPNPPKGN